VLGFSHIAWAQNQVRKGGVKANFVWVETQKKTRGIDASTLLENNPYSFETTTTIQN
jgi:hypothetical protein